MFKLRFNGVDETIERVPPLGYSITKKSLCENFNLYRTILANDEDVLVL